MGGTRDFGELALLDREPVLFGGNPGECVPTVTPTALHERPLVYVAGPYTNPDPVRNTHNAVHLAEAVIETGLMAAFVPHITLLWHAIAPHDDVNYWYELDLSTLKRCDALLRMPGASSGADAEVKFAMEHNIPVFTTLDGLVTWAHGRQNA